MQPFSTLQTDDVVVMSLVGDLDVANVDEVRALAQEALDAPGVSLIVVDLAQVAFMDSTALGAFIGLRNDADQAGILVTLRDLQPRVERLLEITGLAGVFPLESSADHGPDDGTSATEHATERR